MPGVGSGPDQHHIDAGGDESRLQRRLEHVSGHARVLADEHAAAARRQHARRGARQAQRKIHRHRRLPDPAAHAVGAEILVQRLRSLQHRTDHADRIPRRSDIVGADDSCALDHRQRRQPQAAVQPLIHALPQNSADEALARHADQQRRPERAEARQFSQQRQVVRQAFAEPKSRIERNGLAGHAGLDAGTPFVRQELASPRPPRHHSADCPASYAAHPACASDTRPTWDCGRDRARPGARSAYTSLTMQAPAATAAAITWVWWCRWKSRYRSWRQCPR